MTPTVKIIEGPLVACPTYEEIRTRVDSLLECETLLSVAFDSLDVPPRAVLEVLDDISPRALGELLCSLRSRVGLGWR